MKTLSFQLRRVEKALGGRFDKAIALYAGLTDRERQVANAIANGTRSRKIAEDLGISPKTLDIHRTNVLRKLGTKSIVVASRIVYLVRLSGNETDNLCWLHSEERA